MLNLDYEVVRKYIITAYRGVAFLVLWGILAGVVGYVGLLGFYSQSTSWAAPTIITNSNEKLLGIRTQVLSAEQSIGKLQIDIDQSQKTLVLLGNKLHSLEELKLRLSSAIESEKLANNEKMNDIAVIPESNTQSFLDRANALENKANADLRAGIITKDQHSTMMVSALQLRNLATSMITQQSTLRAMSKDLQRQNQTYSDGGTDVKSLDAVAKKMEVDAQIGETNISMLAAEAQIKTDKAQLADLQKVIKDIGNTPYYKMIHETDTNALYFAFVPYENRDAAQLYQPVYDCTFHLFWCHEAGKIEAVFSDEEVFHHPLFNNKALRGFFVQLKLKYPEAAKSKVIFMGGKPLLL